MALNRRIVLEDSEICSRPAPFRADVACNNPPNPNVEQMQDDIAALTAIGLQENLICKDCRSPADFDTDLMARNLVCNHCGRVTTFAQFIKEHR
jgi:hypothetical protein